MDWTRFATVFATIFVAELGDKTQLATLLYAADGTRSRLAVFLASASALVLASALGVAGGAALGAYVGGPALRRLAGLGFVAIGVWMLAGRS